MNAHLLNVILGICEWMQEKRSDMPSKDCKGGRSRKRMGRKARKLLSTKLDLILSTSSPYPEYFCPELQARGTGMDTCTGEIQVIQPLTHDRGTSRGPCTQLSKHWWAGYWKEFRLKSLSNKSPYDEQKPISLILDARRNKTKQTKNKFCLCCNARVLTEAWSNSWWTIP